MHKRWISALTAVIVPVALGSVAVASSASAAGAPSGPVTIVRSTAPLTSAATLNGLTFYNNVASADTNPATGNVSIVNGPGTPTLGSGSLRLGTGSNGDTGVALFDQSYLNCYFNSDYSVIIPFPVTYNPAAPFLSFGYLDRPTDLPAEVMINLWHGGGPVAYIATLPTGSDWQTFDVSTAQFAQQNSDGTLGTTLQTLDQWAQPGDSLFSVFVGADYDSTLSNPYPNRYFYLDDLTYGFGVTTGGTSIHPVTTYDFETDSTAPAQSVTASKSTISAGQSVTMGVTVKKGSAAVAGARMQLWAKPSGSSAYRAVATTTTNSTGHAASVQKPTTSTSYRWRYLGTTDSPELPGVDSAAKTVGVRDVVSAKAADTTLSTHQKLRITGRTTPAKAGARLTVYQLSPGHKHKIGTAKTTKSGTYTFTHAALRAGSYRFTVTIAAQSGNLAGQSAAVKVRVS